MALPSTGPISMSQVRTELGLTGSISLGQSQVRELAGRPSGSISMSHLRGKSAVNWDGSLEALRTTYSEMGNGVNQATVEIIFDPNGNIRLRGNYPVREQIIGTWNGTDANSSNTEIRFVVTSGSLSSNGAPSFSHMTSPRAISVFVRGGSKSATVRIELQQTGDSSTRISKTVNLNATHSSGGGIGPWEP